MHGPFRHHHPSGSISPISSAQVCCDTGKGAHGDPNCWAGQYQFETCCLGVLPTPRKHLTELRRWLDGEDPTSPVAGTPAKDLRACFPLLEAAEDPSLFPNVFPSQVRSALEDT